MKNHRLLIYLFSALVIICIGVSCVQVVQPFSKIPPGIWRAELDIADEVDLPFNFTIDYDDEDNLVITILNDTERIEIRDIEFGRNKKLEDTIFIDFTLLDSYINGKYKENVIEGAWVRRNRPNYRIPFVAFHGQSNRFSTDNETPAADLSGRWQAVFEIETPDQYPAIGEFMQKNNKLTGTFLTETGDYRYLEGEVQGNQFSMSTFDGAHAFLFTGTINTDGSLIGKFYSGNHYQTNWIATKQDDAALQNPYELSRMKDPKRALSFSLPDPEGQVVSLDDDRFKGRPKLITLMGTWCPNCLDESKFILDYLRKNPDLDLAVIAVAFERYRDADSALNMLKKYKSRLEIPYDLVLGGYYDKSEATHRFGFLDTIMSYPTLLFVNRDNLVTKVHTGFSGPATSQYAAFVEEFEKEISRITSENDH